MENTYSEKNKRIAINALYWKLMNWSIQYICIVSHLVLILLVLAAKWLCNSSKSHILTHSCFILNSLLWLLMPPDIFQITLLSSHLASHQYHVHTLLTTVKIASGNFIPLKCWDEMILKTAFFFWGPLFDQICLSSFIYWVLYLCRGETVPFHLSAVSPIHINVELRTMSCSYHFWMSFLMTF